MSGCSDEVGYWVLLGFSVDEGYCVVGPWVGGYWVELGGIGLSVEDGYSVGGYCVELEVRGCSEVDGYCVVGYWVELLVSGCSVEEEGY